MEKANIESFLTYDTCCRTCLRETSEVMINIFDVEDSINLVEILSACTAINVHKKDALPKNMCEHCYKCLISFYEFKKLAENIDIRLKTICKLKKINDKEEDCNKSVKDNIDIENNEECIDNDSIKSEVKREAVVIEIENESDKTKNETDSKGLSNVPEFCEEKFETQSESEWHNIKQINNDELNELNDGNHISENFIDQKSKETETLVTFEKNFVCDICSLSFNMQTSLSKHKKEHINNRMLSCSFCSKTYKRNFHLKRHESSHFSKYEPYECSLCYKTFALKSKYNKHINSQLCTESVECYIETDENEESINTDFIDLKSGCMPEIDGGMNNDTSELEFKKNIIGDVCKKFIDESILKQQETEHSEEIHEVDQLSEVKNEIYFSDDSLELNIIKKPEPNQIFTCKVCSMSFKSQNSLSAHTKIHTNRDRILSCSTCGKIFKKLFHLKRHEVIHTKSRRYICAICSEGFSFLTTYTEHLIKHTKSVKKPRTQSKLDQQHSKRKDKLTKSINEHLNDEPRPADKSFSCSICSESFQYLNSLSAHQRKHTKRDRVLSCSICGKIFKKVSHMKRHELTHSKNYPYKCSLCSNAFAVESKYMEHMNKHNGIKTHDCPLCEKPFSVLSTLKMHMRVHTNNRPYLCQTCGKSFHCKGNLDQHMKRHIGLKSFACSSCPKRFVTKDELKYHSQTHAAVPACACDLCGTTFSRRSSLNKHKMKHLGLKPHQCDICSMKFTSSHHLKRHYRIHTGEKPYMCEICNKSFVQSNDLVKHKRVHFGEKMYKCSDCPKSFRLKTELRRHVSKHYISSQNKITAISRDIKDS